MTASRRRDRLVIAGLVARRVAIAIAARRSAQGDHLEVHLQRRRVSDLPRPLRALPRAGGVAPMSLMTYDDAFPWAESIRAELVAAHMPPWNADEGYGEIKRAHTLTPKELDVILTWATGGNPRGSLDQKLPTVDAEERVEARARRIWRCSCRPSSRSPPTRWRTRRSSRCRPARPRRDGSAPSICCRARRRSSAARRSS